MSALSVVLMVAAYVAVPALVGAMVALLVDGRHRCTCGQHADRLDGEMTREIRRALWWRAADRATGLGSGVSR
ncbi:hypothetical protein [Frankia sp. AvcI1]|uniref:hypothetical protein n=1 Tax=Frankia sp. AvcI1 TaxID=573496 RepID=UPI002117B027|nr:hypothetical protein [Frankia sp. AvcI1]